MSRHRRAHLSLKCCATVEILGSDTLRMSLVDRLGMHQKTQKTTRNALARCVMTAARMRNQLLPIRSSCSDGWAARAAGKQDSSDQTTSRSCNSGAAGVCLPTHRLNGTQPTTKTEKH